MSQICAVTVYISKLFQMQKCCMQSLQEAPGDFKKSSLIPPLQRSHTLGTFGGYKMVFPCYRSAGVDFFITGNERLALM